MFLIVFVLAFVLFIIIAIVSFSFGNPDSIYQLVRQSTADSAEFCGGSDKKRFLFTFDPIKCIADNPENYYRSKCSPSVCVEHCPSLDTPWNWPSSKMLNSKLLLKFCKPKIDKNLTVKQLVEKGDCPAYLFPSTTTSVSNRCEPAFLALRNHIDQNHLNLSKTFIDNNGNHLKSEKAIENLDKAHRSFPWLATLIEDLSNSWLHILILTLVTMLISFIWVVSLRFIGPFLIWFATASIIITTCLVTIISWAIYDATSNQRSTILGLLETEQIAHIPCQIWLLASVLFSFIFILVLLVFCVIFNRIRFAVAIVREASRAVGASVGTLFWPFAPFALQILLHFLFFSSLYFLLAAETTNYYDGNEIVVDLSYRWPMIFCLLFTWFWLSNFILALNYMTLAGSFSSWYWFNETERSERFQTLLAFNRAMRYHVGSMAFGSLIMAFVNIFKSIIQMLTKKLQKIRNPIGQLMLKSIGCCLWAIEKCLKVITKNAYIMIAIEGNNFLASSWRAFKLLTNNSLRFDSHLLSASLFPIQA